MALGRLILFPGLAADERMYEHYLALSVALVTPRLLIPRLGEDMVSYAHRHAQWLDIGDNDIVGGCSFGSMVASEICRQRQTKGLVLLSGALTSDSLISASQKMQEIVRFLPISVIKPVLMNSYFLHKVFGDAPASEIELGRTMIADTANLLLRYGSELAIKYCSEKEVLCPIYSIHGGQDRVIQAPDVVGGIILKDAGHGMVVSHQDEVLRFLSGVCDQLALV